MINLKERYIDKYIVFDRSGLKELSTEFDKIEEWYEYDMDEVVDDLLFDIRITMEELESLTDYKFDEEYQEIACDFVKEYLLPFIKEKGYVPDECKDIPGAEKYVNNFVDQYETELKMELKYAEEESDIENGYGERDKWGNYRSYGQNYINGLSPYEWW